MIPGGFGIRGIEGKIGAIKYARENNIPFLGICLGMQLAVIEFARSMLNLSCANSSEFDSSVKNTKYEIVIYMPENESVVMGGTMRLGSHSIYIKDDTKAYDIYKSKIIQERHRHRYEINPKLVKDLETKGLVFSGKDQSGERSEIVELSSESRHPFYIGCQFHPEYKSRPFSPSLVFTRFVQISLQHKFEI